MNERATGKPVSLEEILSAPIHTVEGSVVTDGKWTATRVAEAAVAGAIRKLEVEREDITPSLNQDQAQFRAGLCHAIHLLEGARGAIVTKAIRVQP